MKPINTALIIVSVILVTTIAGSLYISNLSADQTPPIVRTKTASTYGNLASYTLTFNYTIEKTPASTPILVQTNQPISDSLAEEIAVNVFGMTHAEIIDGGIPGGTWVKDSTKLLQFYGLNTIFYAEDRLNPIVQDWDSAEIQEISDKVLDALSDYWKFETAAGLRLVRIGPFWERTMVSENGTITNVEVKSIGVIYRSSVNGIDIVGNGADFSLEIAEGRVIGVELRMPIVQVTGQQTIDVTPEEAVANFINGWSAAKDLGVASKTGLIPEEGECVIDSVKLVYLAKWSYNTLNEPQMPLLYKITGKLIYTDPIDGSIVTQEFTDYQYATN